MVQLQQTAALTAGGVTAFLCVSHRRLEVKGKLEVERKQGVERKQDVERKQKVERKQEAEMKQGVERKREGERKQDWDRKPLVKNSKEKNGTETNKQEGEMKMPRSSLDKSTERSDAHRHPHGDAHQHLSSDAHLHPRGDPHRQLPSDIHCHLPGNWSDRPELLEEVQRKLARHQQRALSEKKDRVVADANRPVVLERSEVRSRFCLQAAHGTQL